MQNRHDAYTLADKLDELINKALEKHPPSPDNLSHWRLFHRTLSSTLNSLQAHLDSIPSLNQEQS